MPQNETTPAPFYRVEQRTGARPDNWRILEHYEHLESWEDAEDAFRRSTWYGALNLRLAYSEDDSVWRPCCACGAEWVQVRTASGLPATYDYEQPSSRHVVCEDCSGCVEYCSFCGVLFNTNDHTECPECSEHECADCGCSYSRLEHGCCPTCAEREEEERAEEEDRSHRLIGGYHDTRPPWRAVGKGPMFFGLEVETESDDRQALAQLVLDYVGSERVILERDGSLRDGEGLEIISHPHSWERAGDYVHRLCCALTEGKARSYDTEGRAGIHVHVTRNQISQLTIGKLLVHVHDPANASLIDCIAQRPANGYCDRPPKKITDARRTCYAREAINLSEYQTIEFRLYRGNTREARIMKCLEHVKSLLDWLPTASMRQLDAPSYLAWIDKRRSQYPHLAQFLVARGRLQQLSTRTADSTGDN
jgi:hypothetical protein